MANFFVACRLAVELLKKKFELQHLKLVQRLCGYDRPGPSSLRETASEQPEEEQLLPLRGGPLRPHGTAGRDRADCVCGLHRERGSAGGERGWRGGGGQE